MRSLALVLMLCAFTVWPTAPQGVTGANLCANISTIGPPVGRGLPDKIFREDFQSTAIMTDWIAKLTWNVVEVVSKERHACQITDRLGNATRCFSAANGTMFQYKSNDNTCAKTDTPLTPYNFSADALAYLNVTDKGASLSSILSALVKFSEQRKNSSYLAGTSVMSGVENVRWITCINVTNTTTNATNVFMFEAVYSDEQAVKPPTQISHPLLRSLRVALFANSTDVNSAAITHTSVEIDRYDSVKPLTDDPLFSVPHGIICDNWPTVPLPNMLPDDFTGFLQYTDKGSHQVKVRYSPANQMAVVFGTPVDNKVYFFDESLPTELAAVDAVIHDFKYGYEYALTLPTCKRLSPLSNTTRDVTAAFNMSSLSNVLLQIDPQQTFGRYADLTLDGVKLYVYRGQHSTSMQVIEVRVHAEDSSLHSIIRYDKNAELSTAMELMKAPASSWTLLHTFAANCFAGDTTENGTFTFDVQSKSVKDVYAVGSEEVTWSLALALATANGSAPINPHRVKAYFDNSGSNLRVFFSVAKKSDVVPANVGYNFTNEASTEKFLEAFNATIMAGDWTFTVGSSQKWTVLAKSLSRYPPAALPPSPPPYQGYTGGSMFVLGIFALVLGAAIGAGGVFFMTKRQRFSTLAYQVFE